MNSDLIGRDVESSAIWILITKHNPLWSKLPKDLIFLMLNQFLFKVETCWCGKKYHIKKGQYRWVSFSKWMPKDWFRYNCSRKCYDNCELSFERTNYKSEEPEFRNEILPIYGCCKMYGISGMNVYWVTGYERYIYCSRCFEKYSRNGLFLEKPIHTNLSVIPG